MRNLPSTVQPFGHNWKRPEMALHRATQGRSRPTICGSVATWKARRLSTASGAAIGATSRVRLCGIDRSYQERDDRGGQDQQRIPRVGRHVADLAGDWRDVKPRRKV